ncbi:two-component system, cell cycle sensor histidine kinase and response regulator CckA [Paracoccus isoporae]|uniref:histidine kinase n=1 Tax=Paracoccus isoporae TaxID=591205 RepID=A0A1G7AFQ5_9RHOB|nr:ATP-binding protein [Paracoccus isoporae]SDE13619.1 two-component system, cell cycle sensor histidine kinase and response regulator CckA [Paracoccus isoporae]
MARLTGLVPRNAALWVPVLMLPMLIGEIWLAATSERDNPGTPLMLILAVMVLAWYVLGIGIALTRLRAIWVQRRHLALLRRELARSEWTEWAVAADSGVVLGQSAEARRNWGDQQGRPLSASLSSLLADAAGEMSRLIGRAARAGTAERGLGDGRMLQADYIGGDVLRLTLKRQPPRCTAEPGDLAPLDYDRLPIAVLRVAQDGTILHANEAAGQFCGGDATGLHVSKLLDGLGRPYEDWLSEALQARTPPPPEVLRAPRAGQDRFIQVSLHPEAEDAQTLIAVLSDARALKTLEAQFVQSQKMQAIGQLAGGIAHDFNNLLTAISGHCDLLMLRHDKGDPDFGDLDQISQNTNRAANLVSHLLAFSRKQALKPQQLDMRDTIADLSHLLNRLVGEKIVVEMRHDSTLEPVRADRGKIEQVIMNLVVNARDAMPEGGRIVISTENVELGTARLLGRFAVPPGRYVLVRVTDEGVGMPPDVMGKIFEPFFTTKRYGEGTGLGLSTAYGIVKQTGGYIVCDSTPGAGTAFSIYLPAHSGAETDSESPDPDPAKPAAPAAPANRTVLLVEDEDPVRAFAGRALRLHGYEVIEADSGEDALELLRDERLTVDLLISDVVMPGLDGVSWVRRALKDRPGTGVIFMSGYTEDVFEDGRNPVAGAAFLQKPFSLTELVGLVAERLSAGDQRSES